MITKIICPIHNEDTASMVLYPDGAYCFGCKALIRMDTGVKRTYEKRESIDKSFIKDLPTKTIRGLTLPYDESGYYIEYPNTDFYLLRKWETGNNKYKYPYNTTRPMFVLPGGPILVIVEGQLNALSLEKSVSGIRQYFTIASPGSANSINAKNHVDYYLGFDKIIVVVDADEPGVAAANRLKETLYKNNKEYDVWFMEKDLNDMLVMDGQETIEKAFKERVEMFFARL